MIQIRFSTDKSIAHILQSTYDNILVKGVRKLEKIDYKLRKRKMDIAFLETRQEDKIIPKFLNLGISN